MFETFIESEIPTPILLGRDDIQMWPLVYQRGASPWFYIECRSAYEENSTLRMVLIQNIDDFLEFNANESCVIEKVYLVTPKHINRTCEWKMEPLAEIMVGDKPTFERYMSVDKIYVYILENGKQYLNSLQDIEINLENLESLYRATE